MLSTKPSGYFAVGFKYELEILRRSGGKVKSERQEAFSLVLMLNSNAEKNEG